jgi:AcrR family transcriptional regulator
VTRTSVVAASQRRRLLDGITAAVADKGFAGATIADITDRAGVSKKTFYEHFDDKLACFLAAYDQGSAAMLEQSARAAAAARASGLDAVAQLRAGTRAYLDFLIAEELYARTFCLEILAAGPEAVARHRGCREAFARSVQAWHELNGFATAPAIAYEAATGVVYELSSARVATGRAHELPALEDDLVNAQLAILGRL